MYNTRVAGHKDSEYVTQLLLGLHTAGYFTHVQNTLRNEVSNYLLSADTENQEFKEFMNDRKYVMRWLMTMDIELATETETRKESDRR